MPPDLRCCIAAHVTQALCVRVPSRHLQLALCVVGHHAESLPCCIREPPDRFHIAQPQAGASS